MPRRKSKYKYSFQVNTERSSRKNMSENAENI